jgi:FdrA protein
MVVAGSIKRGVYYDSVTLMNVAKKLSGMNDVADAAVVMGTEENRAILADAGLLTPELASAGDADLLIAVKAKSDAAARAVIATVDDLLTDVRRAVHVEDEVRPKSLEAALAVLPGANLALISVAGRYAGELAREAILRGLHVMLFSDNVPLETEIELKSLAYERGLLVMGPDCGTAIINGVPLGFANAVERGPIGIVAASGTGLQEISSLVSEYGSGISQAIGTGGRDVSREVGGITFLAALDALVADEHTEIIVLVSKPPDPGVREGVRRAIAGIGKRVISVFLGAPPQGEDEVRTLEEAARSAASAALGRTIAAARDTEAEDVADLLGRIEPGRRSIRALMSGGTFAAETQIVLADLGIRGVHSNVPTAGARALEDPLNSRGHTVVDLGADEFTLGRPHPMIDYSVRRRRIAREIEDPETAVVMLDVVLGYGAHPDPAGELVDVIRAASARAAVVCSVTGTRRDPQHRPSVVAALEQAGAWCAPSNAAASRVAGLVADSLGGGR